MFADREVGGRQEPPPKDIRVRLGVGFLAYNEEELIAKTVAEAVASLSAIPNLTWHVVVVNDGSRDRTGEIAEELAKKDSRVSVVHHDGNKGYAVATETALRNVPGEVVMVVDGDGQHTMRRALLEAIDRGADVVFCWKKVRTTVRRWSCPGLRVFH
jgi:glycosyltransferase involved in cell wall biosynthesis